MSKIVFVLWKREIKKIFSKKLLLLMEICTFVILVLVFGSIFKFKVLERISYDVFLASGVVALIIAIYSLSNGSNIIEEKKSGMLRELLVLPINRSYILFAKILGNMTVVFIKSLFLLFVFYLLFGFFIHSLFLLLLFIFLLSLVFTNMGIVVAYLLGEKESYGVFTTLIALFIYFFSGIFVPLSSSNKLKLISLVNPLTYGTDGIRYALLGIGEFPFFTNLIVLFLFFVVFFIIGTKILKREYS